MQNQVFGKFFDQHSFLHTLDPRAKFLLLLVMLLNLSLFRLGWLFSGIIVVWGIRLSAIPYQYFQQGLKRFSWFFIFSSVFHLLFTPGKILLLLPLAGVTLTVEGVHNAFFYVLRLSLIIIGAALFTATTSPNQIAASGEKMLAPLDRFGVASQDWSLMLMIAITFIPVVFEEADRLRKAQAARGIDISQGNLLMRAKHLKTIFIPLFIAVIRRSENLALAMESRGYDSKRKRTSWKPLSWKMRDSLVCLLLLASLFCSWGGDALFY